MPATATDVLGIKYGTLNSFLTLIDQNNVDPDTLYFITDKGLLYRGSSLVVPLNVVEANPHPNQENTYTFTLTYYSDNPQTPTIVRFNVPTAEALSAVSSTLGSHRLISGTTYADGKASNSKYGHVMLSDAIEASSPSAASGGTAVTPKGVYDYVNGIVTGLAGAMLYKGTIGFAAAYNPLATYEIGDFCEYQATLCRCVVAIDEPEAFDQSHWERVQRTFSSVPVSGYKTGWTYVAVAPFTISNQSIVHSPVLNVEPGDMLIAVDDADQSQSSVNPNHWTVQEQNLTGAVTSPHDLDTDDLVVGNANNRTVKNFPTRQTHGTFLRTMPAIVNPETGAVTYKPQWTDHALTFGYCDTQSENKQKIAVVKNGTYGFVEVEGAVVSVIFRKDAEGLNCTLCIQNSSERKLSEEYPIVTTDGNGITNELGGPTRICAGDTATFMLSYTSFYIDKTNLYEGFAWHLIAVNNRHIPTNLGDFTNNIIAWAACTTAASTQNKVVDITGFSLQAGSVISVSFLYDVPANAKLKVNSYQAMLIYHYNYNGNTYSYSPLLANVIRAGDTATFIYTGSVFTLIAVDRKTTTTIEEGSTEIPTGDAVYQAIEAAKLKWEPF